MATKGKTVVRQLSELKTSFYVRTALDEDHVLKLAMLMEGGEELPPLEITDSNEIVDGRHRQQAALLLGRTEILCIVTSYDSPAEMVAAALAANEGGAKQPTQADIVHAVRLMIQNKASDKQLFELLPYPRPMSRKFIHRAHTEIDRTNLRKAKAAIAEQGLTLKMAAEMFNVPLDKLRNEINPKKTKERGVQALNATLTNKSKGYSHFKTSMARRMVQGFIDGEIQEADVNAVFKHIDQLNQRHVLQMMDFRSRFEAAQRGEMVNWNAKEI